MSDLSFDTQLSVENIAVTKISHSDASIFQKGKNAPHTSRLFFRFVSSCVLLSNNTSDSLTLAHVPSNGQAYTTTRLDSITVGTKDFAKTGVMFRESTDTDAVYASIQLIKLN